MAPTNQIARKLRHITSVFHGRGSHGDWQKNSSENIFEKFHFLTDQQSKLFLSFHFIFYSLYRVKTSITKFTALQLALSTKQNNIEKKPIYNFMSQLTYKKKKIE